MLKATVPKSLSLAPVWRLPGCVAVMTAKPVFGCTMETRVIGGMDNLLSMVQMPGGIPVGVLAVGRAGAVNAALLSAAVLALSDEKITKAVDQIKAVSLTPS